ncbi:MAG: shikimate kinase [Nitrososphaeria archaeon]|nr:shikimate kinase [Nitrososphaeria archaeon]
MRVKSRVHGAVSIINAIPTGIGGALGVDLWTEAEVEVRPGSGGIEAEIPGGEDPSLVKETIQLILEYSGRRDVDVWVKTRSTIPIGRGLKSSSSAANAVSLAACRALGLNLSPEDVVNLGVDAAIRAGVTITGAFDDAYTSFFGGINITDNYRRCVLSRARAPEGLLVLILVPEEKRYTRSVDVESLRSVRRMCEKAVDLALAGKYWEAMTINGLAIAAALEMDPTPALDALREGAVAAGVSGTGPAVAAVATSKRAGDVVRSLREYGPVIECRPSNLVAEWEPLEADV